MIIQLRQHIQQIGESFTVSVNGEKQFTIAGHEVLITTKYDLFTLDNKRALSVFQRWLSWTPRYSVYFNQEVHQDVEVPVLIRALDYWKNAYSLTYRGEKYRFFAHRELKYSIFRGGKQVARIDQSRWVNLEEDLHIMECNDDEPTELMIVLLLVINLIFDRSVGFTWGLFNYNIGVRKEFQPNDEDWEPNAHHG